MIMTIFNLQKTANQKFSSSINGHVFEFSFRTFRKLTYVSVSVDGELKEGSVVAIPNKPLFNVNTNRLANGVFAFACLEDDYPHFDNFNNIDVKFAYFPYEE